MRPLRWVTGFALLWFTACSGSGMSCGGMQPIPSGFFEGTKKQDDPLQARLSPEGFKFLNTNWQSVVSLLAPGQTLTVPVACSVQSTIIGNMVIADMGSAGCTAESCGLMDGQCTSADVPAEVPVTITGLTLAPQPPSSVKATVNVQIATGKLFVDSVSRGPTLCGFSTPMKCGVDFDSTRATPTTNTIDAQLELVVDQSFSQRLSVRLGTVAGLAACGSSGALPPPECTDSADLVLTSETGGCCPGSSFGAVKDLLLSFIGTQLKSQLQDALDQASCEPCGVGNSCPLEEDGGTSVCDTASMLCMAQGRCVPSHLGVEGRMDPAKLIDPNAASNSEIDLSLMIGHSVSANTGLDLGSRGGTAAVQLSECVPQVAPPPVETIPTVDFDSASDGGYHLAIGIGRPFLDKTGYDLQQAGAICMSFGTSTVDVLHTGLLRPFLPSLGELLGPNDAPMQLVVLPQTPPSFTVKAGRFDPVTRAMVEPLLLLNAKDLQIDFYAELEDRYVRLFTATVDLSIPFSLQPDGCRTVTPVLGELQDVVSNVRFTNSEITAEDPSALAPFIPAVVSMAQPTLAQSLTSFTLPDFGPFAIEVVDVKGVHPAATPGTYDVAALYAKLVNATDCAAPPPVPLSLELTGIDAPVGSELQSGKWPSVRYRLSQAAATSYRIDDGLWTSWKPAGAELEIRSPALLMQGEHRIQVRVSNGDDRFYSVLPQQRVTVDLQAPSVQLVREGSLVVSRGYDSLTPRESLRYAYRLGTAAFTEFGSAREFALEEIDRAGGLTVRVQDEAGRVSETSYGAVLVAERDTRVTTTGCSMGAGLLPLLAALSLLRVRRKR